MEPNENPKQAESIPGRLQRATDELKILEQLILCADFSPCVLGEFRDAIDSIRSTARVVQLWTGLQEREQEQSCDPYSAMSTMSSDRLRRATQITKDLTADLKSAAQSFTENDFKPEELAELGEAVNDLQERLRPLLHSGNRERGANPPVQSDSPHAKPGAENRDKPSAEDARAERSSDERPPAKRSPTRSGRKSTPSAVA